MEVDVESKMEVCNGILEEIISKICSEDLSGNEGGTYGQETGGHGKVQVQLQDEGEIQGEWVWMPLVYTHQFQRKQQ